MEAPPRVAAWQPEPEPEPELEPEPEPEPRPRRGRAATAVTPSLMVQLDASPRTLAAMLAGTDSESDSGTPTPVPVPAASQLGRTRTAPHIGGRQRLPSAAAPDRASAPTARRAPSKTSPRRHSLPHSFKHGATPSAPILGPVPRTKKLVKAASVPEGGAGIDGGLLDVAEEGEGASFPPGEESRADWDLLRHLQADLDARSKQFHARQYAGSDGAGAAAAAGPSALHGTVSAWTQALTPGRGRRGGAGVTTPSRTPRTPSMGTPSRRTHNLAAAGRQWDPQLGAPLGSGGLASNFWGEVRAAAFGVGLAETRVFVAAQRQQVLAHTVVEVVEFQTGNAGRDALLRRLDAEEDGLFPRLAAVRELFDTEAAFQQAVRINPTTRLEDFLKVEEELVFWYNADRALFELFEQGMEWAGKKGEWSTLCEFHTQLSLHRMNTPTGPDGTPWLQQEEGKVVGWAPNSLAFARRCCARLQCLLAEYHGRANDRLGRRALGLPSLSRRFGAGMVQVMRLVSSLMQKDSQYVSERSVGDVIGLAKELLALNTAHDTGLRKITAHMTGSYASCKREYDELLAEIFEQYFVLIRTIGWRFMPELQITSWVTDEQAEGKVSARVSALESEWGFLSSLQPKLQAVVPNAERHFITGMMTLAHSLLRDVGQHLCTDPQAADSDGRVLDQLMGSQEGVGLCSNLLVSDLAFAQRVCDSAYVVSQYQALAPAELLTRLAEAGFRALHVHEAPPVRSGSGTRMVQSWGGAAQPQEDTNNKLRGAPSADAAQASQQPEPESAPEPEPEPEAVRVRFSPRDAPPPLGALDGPPPARRPRHLSEVVKTPPPEESRAQPHRVILVPPSVADDELKELLHAWCSHDATSGYMLLLSSEIVGAESSFDWSVFEEMPYTLSVDDVQRTYEFLLYRGCVCLTAGSERQLSRSREEFEREAHAVSDRASQQGGAAKIVRVVTEKDVAFEETKRLHTAIHAAALQIGKNLLLRAEVVSQQGLDETCDWEDVEGDWMLAFLYCKSLSRLSLTRDECRALSTGGARAASRYDTLKAESAAQHEQRLKRQKAGQKLQGQIMVNMRMLQWRRRAMAREGPGAARKQRAARKHSRRHSTDNAFDPSLVLQLDQPSRMLQQSEEEEDEEEEDGEDLTERFKVTRSGRAMARSQERRRTLLAGVRSLEKGGAPAAREVALGGLLKECRRDGVWLDPRDVQDAKLQVVERTIGALLIEDSGPNASPRSPPAVDDAAGSVMVSVGAEVQMDEKEIFAEKYLKTGRITIFHTTSTYSHATVLKNCQSAREKMAVARDLGVRAEYDLGLPVNAEVIEALKRYSTQGYTLPQVFFGKDLIDDWGTMSDEMLQSFLDQFLEQNQTWMEVPWGELSFGANSQLGAGAQGTVRKGRHKGTEYAVKIFKPDELRDFKEEVRVLEHLRHPNIVAFYGAVTRDSEHHAIIQELCTGSVYDYLQKFGSAVKFNPGVDSTTGVLELPLAQRIKWAHDAAKGMIFLHSRKVIHCDLKSSNLLVANDSNPRKTVKICDFSMSRITTKWGQQGGGGSGGSLLAPTHPDATGSGTPGFISPEEMMGEVVTPKSDVYSFAMILWELLTSSTPFQDLLYGPGVTQAEAKLRSIEICTNDLRPEMPEDKAEFFDVDPEHYATLLALIRRCWARHAEERPDFEQVAKNLAAFFKLIAPQPQRTPTRVGRASTAPSQQSNASPQPRRGSQ